MCSQVLQIPTLFQTKTNRFQTRSLKYTPVFRPGFRQKLCHHFLDQSANKKNASNAFRNRLFPLCSYSSGIERINTFIRTRSSLENHTRFQTKMSKVYTRFQTKHPYPIGRHVTYMAYIGEYPPPPPPGTKIERDFTTLLRFSSQLLSGLRANS